MIDLLNKIDGPQDVKQLSTDDMHQLAVEIRKFMVDNISQSGGHLASSLGVVEIVIGMLKVFNPPSDKIIFDVGHQSYSYKILTGRRDQFSTIRQWQGLSGFPKTSESSYDSFNTGHSSTSISAALGMAEARDLQKKRYEVISVIGDGALSGGMSFEALNNAGQSNRDMIVVLNDNKMSISKNVGAMANYLSRARSYPFYSRGKKDVRNFLNKWALGRKVYDRLNDIKDSIKYLFIPGVIFEEMGFKYIGPIDGNNVEKVIEYLKLAKSQKGPILIHMITKKGKGYAPAESSPDKFHGISPFAVNNGEVLGSSKGKSFSSVFGDELMQLADKNRNIVAITAAMPDGTGLKNFSNAYPSRFFDVGISEQHGVTFSAGLAISGMKPFVAIYSSFMQRAIDQVLHDVCLQNLPVVFGIDRAGLVGEDGETHQGIYDISMLRAIPNLVIVSPSTENEFRSMIRFAAKYEHPIVLRYPRGSVLTWDKDLPVKGIELGKGQLIRDGKDIVVIPLGIMIDRAIIAADILKEKGIDVCLINPRFVKPLDKELILKYAKQCGKIITIEDHVINGGFGSAVLELVSSEDNSIDVYMIGLPDIPITHGKRDILWDNYGLSVNDIVNKVMEALGNTHEN